MNSRASGDRRSVVVAGRLGVLRLANAKVHANAGGVETAFGVNAVEPAAPSTGVRQIAPDMVDAQAARRRLLAVDYVDHIDRMWPGIGHMNPTQLLHAPRIQEPATGFGPDAGLAVGPNALNLAADLHFDHTPGLVRVFELKQVEVARMLELEPIAEPGTAPGIGHLAIDQLALANDDRPGHLPCDRAVHSRRHAAFEPRMRIGRVGEVDRVFPFQVEPFGVVGRGDSFQL